MAVPKRKVSKTRRDKRKAHWKLTAPNLVRCPQCNTLTVQHKVCKECGYYKGKEVVEKTAE